MQSNLWSFMCNSGSPFRIMEDTLWCPCQYSLKPHHFVHARWAFISQHLYLFAEEFSLALAMCTVSQKCAWVNAPWQVTDRNWSVNNIALCLLGRMFLTCSILAPRFLQWEYDPHILWGNWLDNASFLMPSFSYLTYSLPYWFKYFSQDLFQDNPNGDSSYEPRNNFFFFRSTIQNYFLMLSISFGFADT